MKISKFLPFVAMLAAIIFVGCKGDGQQPDTNMVDDGMYIVGEATVNSQLEPRLLMATGFNEVTKTKRSGMYEKYIALEAGKDFWLVSHQEGVADVKYGANNFTATKLATDADSLAGYRGQVAINGPAMKIAESGLYHVIMDLDEDGVAGEKIMLVIPVNFGVRGSMNGWGYTTYEASTFNKESITFTSPENAVMYTGNEYKFVYSNDGAGDGKAWKINLDLRGEAKAEVSLGEGLVTGADNIKFPEPKGLYQIQLKWTLALGENKNSFSTIYSKKGDAPNPTTFVTGFSGSAFSSHTEVGEWGDPVGATSAVYDAAASDVKADDSGTYVYNISNLTFDADKEFKIRYNGAWIGVGGATIVGATFGGTDNYTVSEGATYNNIKFEVSWDGQKSTAIKVTFTK